MPFEVEDRVSGGVSSKTRGGAPVVRLGALCVAVLLAATVSLAFFLQRNWPFTDQAVLEALQQQTGDAVQIASFRQVFFPHPGCVAQRVTFRRQADGSRQPLITIRQLTIDGSYSGLLTRRIASVRAEGLHISIAAQENRVTGSSAPVHVGNFRSGLTIRQIVADGAEVEFLPAAAREKPVLYKIPKLTLHDLSDGKPLQFQATLQIPQPPAFVDVTGKFGPWQSGNAGQTALSGSYTVRDLNLGVFGGIAGMVSAKGQFDGVLQRVNTKGTTETPDFRVVHGGHPVKLKAEYDAFVNGLNGDVGLHSVIAHFSGTTIFASGSIEGVGEDEGKLATLEMYSQPARIQDLLRLFVSEKTPPMMGPVVFRAKVTLPPDDRPFLDKVRLSGDFGISGAQYPNPETQKNVDVLSARAQGKAEKVEHEDDRRGNDSYDPGRVLSNLKGHVELKGAASRLSNVSFDVPGASAQVDGTYNLKSEKIDLQGEMRLDTQLSKATTGVKSVLLKVIQPLTASRKHKQESVVSLKIGGTYHNPTYVVLPIAKK